MKPLVVSDSGVGNPLLSERDGNILPAVFRTHPDTCVGNPLLSERDGNMGRKI